MNFTLSFRRDDYRNRTLRILVILVTNAVCLITCVVYALAEPSRKLDPFDSLQGRLIEDSLDPSLVEAIYSNPQMLFERQGVTSYFLHREATLNYDQFLTPSSIDQAVDYLRKHGRTLEDSEKRYGVESEVITAILLVESRFGAFTGQRRVLNMLSSLAALGDTAKRDMVWHAYVKEMVSESKGQFETWARKKSAWAYRELRAYLKYTTCENVDPFAAYGSYAGALGIAQFVPSSVLKFGQDGNNDGHINLSEHVDAIESVANYLKQHGWKPGLGRDEAFRVILCYNRSSYYADTILKVAEQLSRLDIKPHPNKPEVSE
jgi:membrane-bound lytic murein transglycosylase B